MKAPCYEFFQVVEVKEVVVSIKKLDCENVICVHSNRFFNVTPRLKPEHRRSNELIRFLNQLIILPNNSNNTSNENDRPGKNSGNRRVKSGDRQVTYGRRHVNLSDRHSSEINGAVSDNVENFDELFNPNDSNDLVDENPLILNRGQGKRLRKSSNKPDFVYNLMLSTYSKMEKK